MGKLRQKKKMRASPQKNMKQTIKESMILPKTTAKKQMTDHMEKITCSVMKNMRVSRLYKM